MLTTGARRAMDGELAELTRFEGVASQRELARHGVTRSRVQANLDARRWQRIGPAIVLHSGRLSAQQRWQVALIHCGPRAVLTSFTAAHSHGLRGWEREAIHVLAPAGTRPPATAQLPIRLHRATNWSAVACHPVRPLHQLGPAIVLAAASCSDVRSACGLLAAAVQQRLISVADLRAALDPVPKARHRHALEAALDDIAQGAHALSEIDFVRLCRRHRLPAPRQQMVRIDDTGRRRYFDATWVRHDGRLVVVEVDGALHLRVQQWREDQLRQNDVALDGALFLRYPSFVVRHEQDVVANQLRRALQL
jgi:hypothetical protein